MNVEHRTLVRLFGRQKPWELFVMVGFAVAAIGFALLPTIILTPVAPFLIVGGFSFSLGAWALTHFRKRVRRAIRDEEHDPHWRTD